METERFAPSPTGPLHLGHAFSALTAFDAARAAGGRFLLRIEDLDAGRARPEFEAALIDDLRWLGVAWDGEPWRQSARGPAYAAALARLRCIGLLYPCVCTRADIAAAGGAPHGADDAAQPLGPVYPGVCRGAAVDPARPAALRLDMGRALACAPAGLAVEEIGLGAGVRSLDAQALLRGVGDVALARKDGAAAYHLAVVVDDAAQGVTTATRGADLAPAAPLHRLLQALLGLPALRWRHHRLITDAAGRRLAKRDDARSLAALRAEGATPADVRRLVGL